MRPVVLAILCFACSLSGCGSYSGTIDNAVASDPSVRAFAQLFPDSRHFISYFSATHGQPTWNSEVLLHSRYVLTMQFEIDIDRFKSKIRARQEPSFYLVEVGSITSRPRVEINYTPNQIRFGLPEWQQLVESGGDLSVLRIHVVTDSPVPGLHEYWASTR